MSQEPEDDDLEPEYDFSGAVRGKYYQRVDLSAAYRDMAGEKEREAEAHAWAEATVEEVALTGTLVSLDEEKRCNQEESNPQPTDP